MTELFAVRDSLTFRLTEIEAELEQSSDSVFLDQQRENFAGFMVTCRGPYDPTDPAVGRDEADPVTQACAAAWQAELEREQQSVLQSLAQQAPPGILLLFLLATFGALYRYNLRLEGFHNSRADMLELMKAAGGYDPEAMLRVADALAADKVEFGKVNTPADQAVEIARAVMGRAK